jgi:hypothetical protein
MRNSDHGGVPYTGVEYQLSLDLRRIDVHAAADDHVLLAAGDPVEALGIAAREVAGVEPAFGVQGGGRGLGIVPISMANVGAADQKLPHLALLVHEAGLSEHQGLADRAGMAHRLLHRHREAVHADLGHAVALLEDHAAPLVVLDDPGGKWRAAANEPAHAGKIDRFELGRLGQHLPDGRNAQHDRGPLRFDRSPDLGGIEAAMEDYRPADCDNRNQKGPEPTRVVERCEDRADVVLPELPAEHCVVAVPDDHPVREHHPLGLARGAGGVEQAPEVFGTSRLRLPLGVGHLQGFFKGHPAEDVYELPQLAHLVRVFRAIKESRGRRVRKDAGHFVNGQPGAERDEDHSRLGRGEEGVEDLRPVVREQRDPVPLLKTEALAPEPRHADGAGVHLGVVEALARRDVDQAGLVRRQAGALT